MAKQAALLLAAGKGTRMHSEKPKVLQELLGSSLLSIVEACVRPLFGNDVWALVGFHGEQVAASFDASHCIWQKEQLGTGHAVLQALDVFAQKGYEKILVINGDAPLITTALVQTFLDKAKDCDIAFASANIGDPGAYGRVVRTNGAVSAIVEAKNYDESLLGKPSGEINVGLYSISLEAARALLPNLTKNPVSGEYYLTDIVENGVAAGYRVIAVPLGSDTRLLGINSPKELAEMEDFLARERVASALESGVILHAKDSIRIGPFVELEPGCEIEGPCALYGKTVVRKGACIESHCVIEDSEICTNAKIHPFCHIKEALVGENTQVGPYARLRPGAHLDTDSHVGNFVELKKTHLGVGAKANHLSYLGDSEIGARTNIGAGTITCNYDGVQKHRTTIGEEAFIGSNTALVAPVTIGNRALIGAGSTITSDVPEATLAVARSKQKHYPRRLLGSKNKKDPS